MRPRIEGWNSIERVFKSVTDHLPPDIDAVVVQLPDSARGILGRVEALFRSFSRSSGIHHVTGDTHFLVVSLPWRRTVLTVHDLIRFSRLRGPRRWVYRIIWLSVPIRLAASITVISEQTRKELVELFPYADQKLHVVPNPLPIGIQPTGNAREFVLPLAILHVGTTDNKNLDLSIAVAKRVGATLLILGRLAASQLSSLRKSEVAFFAQHDVPDEEVERIYQTASLLLFPSFAEGFGLPIIEAQACGIPVVTSNCEPMRSVAGGGALLIDPTDVDAAEEAVRRIVDDSGLRAELIQEGFSNAARYQPESIAEAYASIYRSLGQQDDSFTT
jgi:glycosyltransferase involved in cell wall biosynthesis